MLFVGGLLAVGLSLAGCARDDSFAYTGSDRINFTSDSIYFSFGSEPFSVMDTTLQIKVELIGRPVSSDREYDLHVDPSRTSARETEHYDPLQKRYTLAAGQSSAVVPVTIHRLNLQEEEVYTLSLELEENADFGLGVVENRRLTIAFTNRLDCPVWWNELSHWLGEYDVRKYQKFIELFGRPITQHDINTNKYGVLRVFKQVKQYFEANPQFDVRFPDVDWEV